MPRPANLYDPTALGGAYGDAMRLAGIGGASEGVTPPWFQALFGSEASPDELQSQNYMKVLDELKGSVPDVGDLQKGFQSRLMSSLDHPGLSPEEVQAIVNQGSEEINAGERAAGVAQGNALRAAGFQPGGGVNTGAAAASAAQYQGQRANLGRDVRIEAAKNREQQRMQGLGMAGDYLGQVQGQRNRMLEFMAQGNPAWRGGGSGSMSGGGGGMQYSGAHFGAGGGVSGEKMNLARGVRRQSTGDKFSWGPGGMGPR